MFRRLFTLLCVPLLLMLGLAAPASAADGMRAFSGDVSGTVYFEPTTDPSCVVVPVHAVSQGSGVATHLGPVTMTSLHCGGNTIAGVMTLVGKHGSVVLSYQGECTPPVPPIPPEVTCTSQFTVISGSGRFQGASGSGSSTAHVYPDLTLPDPLQGIWTAQWTFQGRIAY